MNGPRGGKGEPRRQSWLPKAQQGISLTDAPPWQPLTMATAPAGRSVEWATLSYIVVDELTDDNAGLIVADWPVLDRRGRLRFPGLSWRVGATQQALDRFLAEHRVVTAQTAEPESVRRRPLRIGDAFAATTSRGRGRMAAAPKPARWLKPPVYDVTSDARDAAKAALYGAVAPVMTEDELARIAQETDKDQG